MALDKPYTDVPGTIIFDAEQSRKGYWINQFCMSLMKAKNRERLQNATSSGKLRQLLKSNVLRIEPDAVVVDCGGKQERLPNDAVIVSAGGVLPTAFLESIGINVETKHGTA